MHILRWDAGLAAFETDALLARYPEVADGTNPVLRKAAGLWVRRAVERWHADYPDAKHILIGEAPISGNRYAELVHVQDDAAEPLLSGDQATYLFPVPTNDLRRKLEAMRRTSFAAPRHAEEAKDAPPSTMDHVWRDTWAKAVALGLIDAADFPDRDVYDATVCERFFAHLLRHRNWRALHVDALYPMDASAHELGVEATSLTASPDEVADAVATLEKTWTQEDILRAVETWHQV